MLPRFYQMFVSLDFSLSRFDSIYAGRVDFI